MPNVERAVGAGIVTTVLGVAAADSVITNNTTIGLGTALTVFGAAFGAWAVLLGWVMLVLNRKFDELREMFQDAAELQRERDEKAHSDRIHIERRITEVEAAIRNGNK